MKKLSFKEKTLSSYSSIVALVDCEIVSSVFLSVEG